MLKLMTDFNEEINNNPKKNKMEYAMGLQQRKIGDYHFIGHNSAYGGMMFYDKNKDFSIIFSVNQAAATHKAEWLINKLAEATTC